MGLAAMLARVLVKAALAVSESILVCSALLQMRSYSRLEVFPRVSVISLTAVERDCPLVEIE
jgi:hypothetical protein